MEIKEDDLVPAVIMIPKNTIGLTMTAQMFVDDKIISASSKMSTEDVVNARIDGNDWENENCSWVLVDPDDVETKL